MIGLFTSEMQAVLPQKLQCQYPANTILKGNPFISAKNSFKPPIKNIITIVDNKFISLE